MATQTPKISSYEMGSMTGTVPPLKPQVVAHERAAVDGYSFVQIGARSKPFTLVTRMTSSSYTRAQSTAVAFESMQATLVSVREPGGRSHSGVMVLGVVTQITPLALSTDGNEWVITATWTMQRG